MASLRTAATASDAALDLALLRVGILAPVDLDEIRTLFVRSTVTLRATANRDGHRIVEVVENGRTFAQVHHDGRVFTLAAA
jgi:hypothetical protein